MTTIITDPPHAGPWGVCRYYVVGVLHGWGLSHFHPIHEHIHRNQAIECSDRDSIFKMILRIC